MEPDFKVKRRNSFEVIFSENLNVEPWEVTSINLPSSNYGEWRPLQINFFVTIPPEGQPDIIQRLQDYKVFVDDVITINHLNEDGRVIAKWEIRFTGSDVNFGSLDYQSDSIWRCSLVLLGIYSVKYDRIKI